MRFDCDLLEQMLQSGLEGYQCCVHVNTYIT